MTSVRRNYRVLSTCILGASLSALEPFSLSEPVQVTLRQAGEGEGGGRGVLPAWWDPVGRSWSPAPCRAIKERRESVVFSCSRLGHYALVQEVDGTTGVRLVQGEFHPQ